MHTINAIIHWTSTIHNELYDVQSIYTLNIPQQKSRRTLNRAFNFITLQIQQEKDHDDVSVRSGLVKLNDDELTVHKTSSKHVVEYINTESTYIHERLIDREHMFYEKYVAQYLKDYTDTTAVTTTRTFTALTKVHTESTTLRKDQKRLTQSLGKLITQNMITDKHVNLDEKTHQTT